MTYLGSVVNPRVQAVQEAPLSREGPYSDDTLQQLSEVGEDRRARVRLHPPQVTTGVEVPDGQFAVHESDEESRHEEVREDDTARLSVNMVICRMRLATHAMMTIPAKKLARALFTAWREPAREESMVSISLPKRFSIRPRNSVRLWTSVIVLIAYLAGWCHGT